MPIDSIFSNVVEGTQEGAAQECELRKPDLELRLQAENNKAIAEYRKAVEDYPKNVCCSCQELHQRKNVTVVKFDNHLGTAVWPLLKQYMLQKNPKAVDEAVQDVVEVVKKTSSTVLEKATKEDISNLQCYTIRNLSTKQFTGDDIEQYKLMNMQEEPIDSRQKYLDVMCFPTLFPDGNFGKYHDRQKKISHSEYIKSRLLNKDSRFRKDPRYVFYLLWHKELREVSAGVTWTFSLWQSHLLL